MKRIIFTTAAILLVLSLKGQSGRADKDLYVIAHLNEKLPSNTNIVYTPTMRAAWTMLKDNVVGERIILTKSLSLTAALNSYSFRVPESNDWLAMSGFVENGIIDKINNRMKNQFGISDAGLDEYTDEEGIICFSYLHKITGFRKNFETLKWDFPSKDGSKSVECFGVSKGSDSEKKAIREQVRIYDYRHPDDFIVKISSSEPGKELILAKVPFGGTLSGMVQDIDRRINLPGDSRLTETDELVIPKINFDIMHSYDEFLGLHLKNDGFEKYFFVSMLQKIKFSLNESGAEAIATGEIVLKKGAVSRHYIFDKPFMAILRDKNSSEPEMVLWVDNTGILQPAE